MASSKKNTNFIGRIKKQKNITLTDLPYLKLVYLSILFCVACVVAILALQRNIPPEVPLFYGLPDGADQLGKRFQLVIPSSMALGIILVNVILAYFLKNEYLKQTLVVAGVVAALFSTITTLRIILLIGSF
jgi:hypothetical protein